MLHSSSVVGMGNPHAIVWVGDVKALDIGRVEPRLESDPSVPERANIALAQVVDQYRIIMQTWERRAGPYQGWRFRGVRYGGHDLGLDLTNPADTYCPTGGEMLILWRESDERVLMTGPAVLEFQNAFHPPGFARKERNGRATLYGLARS